MSLSVKALTVALGLALTAPLASAASWHGDYFPNTVLTDQDGKTYKFYDDLIKNKIVTINFMFTNCNDICPADTAQLSRVHTLLNGRVGKDFFMYSISIDPKHDTPAVLKRYMKTFAVGAGWKFLTGDLKEILILQKKLGMRAIDPKKPQDHDTSIMIGNEKTGHWIKRSVYDDPVVMANLLTDNMTNYKVNLTGKKPDYSAAKNIPAQSRGEYLFKTRCSSCHTIGEGDRLGPDLAGVAASRPRAWLRRWIKEPDKMLAERDPLALALKAKYRNLPMPNFGFGDIEANALIAYMQEKDAARLKTPASKPAKAPH